MDLSDEERDRIRLEEKYRVEVRRELGDRKPGWLTFVLQCFGAPVAVVLLSGLIFPFVLSCHDRNTRRLALQADLITELARQSGAYDNAAAGFLEETDWYWDWSFQQQGRLGDIALKRDTGRLDDKRFDQENDAIEEDRKAANDRWILASERYHTSRNEFRTWSRTFESRLRVSFGDRFASSPVPEIAELRSAIVEIEKKLDEREDKLSSEMSTRGKTIQNLREQWRAKTITPRDYYEKAHPIIDGWKPPEVPPPVVSLPPAAIETLMNRLQETEPTVP